MFFWQVSDVCDVGDHDNRDELCGGVECFFANPKHTPHEQHRQKGTTELSNHFLLSACSPIQNYLMKKLLLYNHFSLHFGATQVLLNILPRLLRMTMQRWTPEQEEGDFKMFAVGNGTPLRRRRRSSLGLIAKADEYMFRTARSELMFSRLKEREGLLKNTLEKIGELNYNSKVCGW